MDTLREVVIDEARWPRMFAKLRRAGLYSSCGCEGCGSCQSSAQRFVRGSARAAQKAGATGSADSAPWTRWRRRIGDTRLDLLVHASPNPTVVDLTIDAPPSGFTAEDEELRGTNRWLTAIESRVWPAGAKEQLRGVYSLINVKHGDWQGPTSFAQLDRPASLPGGAGLYFIVWPHGAYLGKASNMLDRVRQHRRSYRQFNFGAPTPAEESYYKVYWLLAAAGDGSGGVTDLENRYLNLIAGLPQVPRLNGAAAARAANRVPTLHKRGFRNLQEIEVS